MEITVLGEPIEVALHLGPRINAIGFTADESQTAQCFVSAGTSAIKLSALLP